MSFKPTFGLYGGDDIPMSRICDACNWVYPGMSGKHKLKRCDNWRCPSNAEDPQESTPTEESSMTNPKTTRIKLPAEAALRALGSTILNPESNSVLATFETRSRPEVSQDVNTVHAIQGDGVIVRVDMEAAEGLYRIHLKPDGTWVMEADVVIDRSPPEGAQ